MADDRPNFDSGGALDAYLDGQLSEPMRSRFEEQLSRDPSLRAQVDRQQQIDQSLRRVFATSGSAEAILANLITHAPHAGNGRARQLHERSATSRTPFVRKPLMIAAAIVFLVCGPFAIYFAWESFSESSPTPLVVSAKNVQALDVAYHAEVKNGFVCDWECKTQSEFASYFASGFNQPLMMKDVPAGVASIGLKYTGGITPYTIAYMAKVNDQPVMVFADKAKHDAGQKLTDPKLKIFERKIGKLVLYEVTPLNEPKLLDLFYQP